MFKLINKIQFSKESNRMKEIANTVIARKLYQEAKSKNLKFLLKERFGWMNNFINNSGLIIISNDTPDNNYDSQPASQKTFLPNS